MKKLIVAEKPSVARDIARVLKVSGKGDGYLESEDYIVTWALGHLVSLCEPDEIDESYKKWRMDALPILPENIPTKVLPKTKSQFGTVKKLMNSKEVASLICATDAGREGELIFRYIYEQAGCTKPFERLWISSMTDTAIKAGFSDLRPSSEYDALYDSARMRSVADWLVGMNASRAFTLRYNALLSIGRVQTPTLALIVGRDNEIENFVPEEYCELRADHGDFTAVWFDPKTNQTRIPNAEESERVRALVEKKTAVITESTREKKSTPPPLLFDLTSLQREANAKLGFSADKTLKVLQSLYETRKLVTYPRTDSRYLPTDMIPKVEKTLRALDESYKPMTEPILRQKLSTSPRIYDNEKISDHHAVIPTGEKRALSTLSPDEKNLYDMVVRRFIAVHYPNYEYESAKIVTECEGQHFKATGVTPLKEGWKALYRDDKQDKEETLPAAGKGETRVIKKAKVEKKKTKPPARMTDAGILDLMENAGKTIDDETLKEQLKKGGIGTPATRAAVIERLIQVGYVQRKGKTLISTEKGRKLIAVAPEQITSAATTGKWEKALGAMAEIPDTELRRQKTDRFLSGIRKFSYFLVDAAKNGRRDIVFPKEEYRAKKRPSAPKKPAAPKAPPDRK